MTNELLEKEGVQADTSVSKSSIFKNRNFRLLWIGGTVSQFGDQFFLIALPWLVLAITANDALALGSVMAAAAVPRALFMVFGGAMTDRFSPKLILICSASLRTLLVGLLGFLVLFDVIELWMLFVLSLIFGLADAFALPAGQALLPRLVDPHQLAPGNAFLSGAVQVAGIIGPAAAGLLIAFFGSDLANTSEAAAKSGIGAAFLVDASTFAVVVLVMVFVKLPPRKSNVDANKEGIFQSIKEGLRFVLSHPSFRAMLIVAALMNFLLNGPAAIGLPIMAKTIFDGEATSFGLMMGATALGMLIGFAGGGALPRPHSNHFGVAVFLSLSLSGVGFVGLALSPTVGFAMAALFIGGIFNGYGNIMIMTWLQQKSPEHIMGRVMGLVMTFSGGLVPISMAAAGALFVLYDVRVVLGIAAGLMTTIALIGTLLPSIQKMDLVEVDEQWS